MSVPDYSKLTDAEFYALSGCLCTMRESCDYCDELHRRNDERWRKRMAEGKVDFGASATIRLGAIGKG